MKLWNESSLCYRSVSYQVGRLILDGEYCGRLSFSSVWSKAVLKHPTYHSRVKRLKGIEG